VPRRWAAVELGEGRRGRAGCQAGRDPGHHPSDEQPAEPGRHDEHDGVDRTESERREQHWPPSYLVGGTAGQQECVEDADRVRKMTVVMPEEKCH
jgi:hypothetical protein